MLDITHANRLYTDQELLDKFANHVIDGAFTEQRLADSIALISHITGYDPDFIKGFMGSVFQKRLSDPNDPML